MEAGLELHSVHIRSETKAVHAYRGWSLEASATSLSLSRENLSPRVCVTIHVLGTAGPLRAHLRL